MRGRYLLLAGAVRLPTMGGELFFMLVILKIPVVYLCAVVWWAVRAEPRPLEGAIVPSELRPDPRPSDRKSRRPHGPRPRGGPHGSPVRRPAHARPAFALASASRTGRPV